MKGLQTAGCRGGGIVGAVVDEDGFAGIGVQCANRRFKNFRVGFLQVEFLAQKDVVKKIFKMVAVCAEPVLAAIFPVQFVGIAQKRNGDVFSLAQAAERIQLAFGDVKADGVPRLFDIVRSSPCIAFACNLFAEALRVHETELVVFHQLSSCSALFKFDGRQPQSGKTLECVLHPNVQNDSAQVEDVILEHA